jgi:hypothetical protein
MKQVLCKAAELLRKQIIARTNPWLDIASSVGGVENQTQWDSWNCRQLEFACKLHEAAQGSVLTEKFWISAYNFLEGKTDDRHSKET